MKVQTADKHVVCQTNCHFISHKPTAQIHRMTGCMFNVCEWWLTPSVLPHLSAAQNVSVNSNMDVLHIVFFRIIRAFWKCRELLQSTIYDGLYRVLVHRENNLTNMLYILVLMSNSNITNQWHLLRFLVKLTTTMSIQQHISYWIKQSK